jgi:HlyD family secretion protein
MNDCSILTEDEVVKVLKRFFLTVLRLVLILISIYGSISLSGCGFCRSKIQSIEATGNVEMTEIIISSKVTGRVEQMMSYEGQKVKKGDLLLQLDHEDLEAQIASAEANLALADLRYQKMRSYLKMMGKDRQAGNDMKVIQIELAENNKNAAQANYEKATRDLARMTELYQVQAISTAEYDQAVTTRDLSQAQYMAYENQLALAKNASESDDIFLAGRQAEAQLKQAQANLALVQTQFKNSQILAPIQGVIANKLSEIGEIVAPETPLFVILDNANPWVKIYLPLIEAEQVSLGQKALIHIDAFPRQKYTGRISFISDEAEFTPKNYQSKDERVKQVYAAQIELDNSSGIFKAGMPVDVVMKTK